MPVRAFIKDGTNELVASAAENEDAVKANLGSFTGSGAPDAEVTLESGRTVPLAQVDRFAPEP